MIDEYLKLEITIDRSSILIEVIDKDENKIGLFNIERLFFEDMYLLTVSKYKFRVSESVIIDLFKDLQIPNPHALLMKPLKIALKETDEITGINSYEILQENIQKLIDKSEN